MTISPEQQLRNVAAIVIKNTTVTKYHTGQGRSRQYAADADTIADSARQLAEMILRHLDGELPAISGDCPF